MMSQLKERDFWTVHNGLRHKVIDNFLTNREINGLMELLKQKRLQKSTGWDVEKGEASLTDYRTSENAFLQPAETPLIAAIEQRIADMTQTPVENGEGMQILRYGKGQYYKPHHDYFDPRFAGNATILKQGGQRVITVLMYLATLAPGDGGETRFPDAKVTVRPVEARALIWPNTQDDGETVDPITLHEAVPVAKEGVYKFVMTKWIRKNRFGYNNSSTA